MGIATQAQTAQGTQERTPRFAGLRAAISTMFELLAILVVPALFFASITIAFQVLIPGASDFALGPVPVGKIISGLASGVMTVSIEAAMVGCSSLADQAKAMENEGLKQKYQNFGWTFFLLFLATIGFHIFNVDPQYAQYLELVRCAAAGLYAFLCHGDSFDPDVPTPSTQREIEMLQQRIESQNAVIVEERKKREQEKKEYEALIAQKFEALLQKKLPEIQVDLQQNFLIAQGQLAQNFSIREEKNVEENFVPDHQKNLQENLPSGQKKFRENLPDHQKKLLLAPHFSPNFSALSEQKNGVVDTTQTTNFAAATNPYGVRDTGASEAITLPNAENALDRLVHVAKPYVTAIREQAYQNRMEVEENRQRQAALVTPQERQQRDTKPLAALPKPTKTQTASSTNKTKENEGAKGYTPDEILSDERVIAKLPTPVKREKAVKAAIASGDLKVKSDGRIREYGLVTWLKNLP
jgi:hypothetical protein